MRLTGKDTPSAESPDHGLDLSDGNVARRLVSHAARRTGGPVRTLFQAR
jgi:hypothetical protein